MRVRSKRLAKKFTYEAGVEPALIQRNSMLTREQRRRIQELAYGTFERNSTIRFCVSAGFLTPIQLARAFKMTKQRINEILHPDGRPPAYKIPAWCKMPTGYHHDGIGGCWGISYGYLVRQGEKYCLACEYYKPTEKG